MKREDLARKNGQWTRREVLRSAVAVAALSPLQGALAAASLIKPPTIAYVAASGIGDEGLVQVFAVANGVWSCIQQVPTQAPSCLVLSHDQRVLYVANDVAEDAGLPRGTIEAFLITPDGRLTLLGTRALALSGTHPRAMALSPDGKLLVAAAYEGGLYSLFSVASDGRLGTAKHSYKQTGSGRHPTMQKSAHPHSLVFDERSGHLLASDFGADRLSLFSVADRKLKLQAEQSTGAGSGPGVFVLHSESGTVFAAHEIERTLVSYPFDKAGKTLGNVMQRVAERKLNEDGFAKASLALHPSGKALYSAWANQGLLTAWRIDAQTGQVFQPRTLELGSVKPLQLVAVADGSSLTVVDRDAIYRVRTDAFSGEMGKAEKVATIANARFVALKTL